MTYPDISEVFRKILSDLTLEKGAEVRGAEPDSLSDGAERDIFVHVVFIDMVFGFVNDAEAGVMDIFDAPSDALFKEL